MIMSGAESSLPKLIVLQIEDRPCKHLHVQCALMRRNERACAQHGIEYHFMSRPLPAIPPFWRKVFVVKHILDTRPDVDFVMWVDSDAWLYDIENRHPLKLTTRHPSASFWISPDPPVWNAPTNAGVFLVRNDVAGRDVMAAWQAQYKPRTWCKDARGRWKTSGAWAGPTYEQGAFNANVLKDARYKPHIRVLPWYVFCETQLKKPHKRCIVIHLAGGYKHKLTLPDSKTCCTSRRHRAGQSLPHTPLNRAPTHGPQL